MNRTLTELRDDAIKQLNDILKQQQDSERAFQKTRLDLIRQGRPSTPLQEAQDRLTQLFELEQKHLREQVDSEKQQDALRERVGLLDNAFTRADDLLSKLEKTFSGLNQTLSGLGNNLNLSSTLKGGGTTNNNNVNLAFTFTGASQQQVNQALDTVENRLSRLGLTNSVAGSFNSGRPFTP